VELFKTKFHINNTAAGIVNSFNKLMKDYPQAQRGLWKNRMVDQLLLFGETNSPTDDNPNSVVGEDVGLYESANYILMLWSHLWMS
jgi:hypothetical protein